VLREQFAQTRRAIGIEQNRLDGHFIGGASTASFHA
jgi:hypothetical protein